MIISFVSHVAKIRLALTGISLSLLRVTSKITKGSEDEDDDDDDSIDWGPDSEDETSSSDGDGGIDSLRCVRESFCHGISLVWKWSKGWQKHQAYVFRLKGYVVGV